MDYEIGVRSRLDPFIIQLNKRNSILRPFVCTLEYSQNCDHGQTGEDHDSPSEEVTDDAVKRTDQTSSE